MKTLYKNPWHKTQYNKNVHGPAFYETDTTPKEYKGYLIYHRIDYGMPINSGANVFDIVKDGVCVGQYAGPNGARAKIDSLIKEVTE